MLLFSAGAVRGALFCGKLLLPSDRDRDLDQRNKPSPRDADASPPREKRSRDYCAMFVETPINSEVARCTGFLIILVTSTLMMGATDMTAARG